MNQDEKLTIQGAMEVFAIEGFQQKDY